MTFPLANKHNAQVVWHLSATTFDPPNDVFMKKVELDKALSRKPYPSISKGAYLNDFVTSDYDADHRNQHN